MGCDKGLHCNGACTAPGSCCSGHSNSPSPAPHLIGSLTQKPTVVLKVGTSSLVRTEQMTINLSSLARICETVKTLHDQGYAVIVVSSGAVGVGCQKLGLKEKPNQLAKKQALAAVGQGHLMRFYEDFLSSLGLVCAQVLLTLDNLADRDQYLNARNTFSELIHYDLIPIVNENDTVAVRELRFGDNDTLSAQVATLVEADWLFIMTDVDCLYTTNPKYDPDAQPISDVEDLSQLTADTRTKGTQWGTGGMATKLTAARVAVAAGCTMVICNSNNPEAIPRVLQGEKIGTKFHPMTHALRGRKRWLLMVPLRGALVLDAGAVRALQLHKSLFAPGIKWFEGHFAAHDAVRLLDENGVEFGRGLVNYSSEEVMRIKGKPAKEFEHELGIDGPDEVVHRENLAFFTGPHDAHHEDVH